MPRRRSCLQRARYKFNRCFMCQFIMCNKCHEFVKEILQLPLDSTCCSIKCLTEFVVEYCLFTKENIEFNVRINAIKKYQRAEFLRIYIKQIHRVIRKFLINDVCNVVTEYISTE